MSDQGRPSIAEALYPGGPRRGDAAPAAPPAAPTPAPSLAARLYGQSAQPAAAPPAPAQTGTAPPPVSLAARLYGPDGPQSENTWTRRLREANAPQPTPQPGGTPLSLADRLYPREQPAAQPT